MAGLTGPLPIGITRIVDAQRPPHDRLRQPDGDRSGGRLAVPYRDRFQRGEAHQRLKAFFTPIT